MKTTPDPVLHRTRLWRAGEVHVSPTRSSDDAILRVVPVISVFFGIIVRMFYREHDPPHFHAEYQGQQATFDFSGSLREGQLQSRTASAYSALGGAE